MGSYQSSTKPSTKPSTKTSTKSVMDYFVDAKSDMLSKLKISFDVLGENIILPEIAKEIKKLKELGIQIPKTGATLNTTDGKQELVISINFYEENKKEDTVKKLFVDGIFENKCLMDFMENKKVCVYFENKEMECSCCLTDFARIHNFKSELKNNL